MRHDPTPQSPARRSLPRGPHGLDADAVASSQRSRLLDAMVESVAARGYVDTTVADVIRIAGVSRKTFYELFENKQDCFVAAFDHVSDVVANAVLTDGSIGTSADALLTAGYRALCESLASMPNYARAFALVTAEAGSAAQRRRTEWTEMSIMRLKLLYRDGAAIQPDLPDDLADHVARAIVGGADALMVRHILDVGPESLPRLVPTLASLAKTLMMNPIDPPDDATAQPSPVDQ